MGVPKVSQRQVVAEITPVIDAGSGEQGPPPFSSTERKFFAQISGGEITSTPEKVYDGGATFPDLLCAPADIGDITLTRVFSLVGDSSALKRLRPMVGRARYHVKVYTMNCDMKDYSTERNYYNALCTGITEPEGDASSGGPATFSLTFAVGAVD